MIPEAAVEAAHARVQFHLSLTDFPDDEVQETLRLALEAAAPHMLAEAKAEAWDECEAAKYEIRLNESGDTWEPVKANPYRNTK